MGQSLEAQWLEDQRGPLKERDRGWWRCSRWVTSVGFVCSVALWGWWLPLVTAVLLAGVAVGAVVPFLDEKGPILVPQIADRALLAGLTATGAAGLVAGLGLLGIFLILALVVTAPASRRVLVAQGRMMRKRREAHRGPH